jgi:CheY-like chemotaxis protein
VVEDEVLIRMLAVDMLADLGFQCDEAGNAAEAMERLGAAGARYAFVFLDIGLPDRRGDEVIKEIRTSQGKLPLLIASGEDLAALKSRLGTFAPIAFLAKPYDEQQLRRAVQALPAGAG